MSFNTSEVLSDALNRTFSRNGILVMAGMFLASLLGTIGLHSMVFDSFIEFWDEFVEEFPELAELVEDPEDFLPLAFDIPDALSLFLVAISIIASLVLLAVAIRAFHGEFTDELPTELVFDNIAWVAVNLFVGGIVFGILWMIGLVFFIIPGIIIFVLFVYFMAAVVIEDRNFVDAFATSVRVTKGERISVFVLFLAIFLIALAVSIAFGLVGSFFILVNPIIAELIDILGRSIIMVYFAAAVAISYRELNQPADEDDADESDEEDPFEEFTPASEGAQW